MSWGVQVLFLSENVILGVFRCLVCRRLVFFRLAGSFIAGADYIDLANTYLFVEAQIVDDDDTALDGGEDIGPVNLWMHSIQV
jgi:hypothetical protein